MAQALTRHAVRVTAALSELRQSHGDVLDALIPFFEPVLSVMSGRVFDPGLLAAGVQKLYRWRFTKDVAEQFIPRLTRKEYLRREGAGRDAVYIVTFTGEQSSSPLNETFLKVLSGVVDEFAEFPAIISDLLHYTRTREQLEDILMRFLVSIDAFGEGALDGSRTLPANSTNTDVLSALDEGGRPLEPEDRYIAARFVSELCKRDPGRIADLTKIAAVGLLTEVVEDFVRPTDVVETVDLTIVLDAPVALDYLGLSGKDLQADVKGVFEALRSIGCRFVIFPITSEEMQRNLQAMLSLPVTDRHGYTHQAMVRGEVMNEFVQAVANDPEKALVAAGISVRNINLDQFPSYHPYFPEETYEDFLASVTWVVDVKPREHDSMCLALLMRLRQGHQSSDLFKCKYVFVTRNPAFARRSRDYCVQSGLLTRIQEGPVVHQRELATIAWLRTGLNADIDIPRGTLVAACERVLRVRPEVTKAVAEKLKQVTTPEKLEQFKVLLLDQRSLRKLADTTLNDERVVTSDNAEQLLELMRQATAEDERRKFDEALGKERARYKAQQEALKASQAAQLAKRDSLIEAKDRELLARVANYHEASTELALARKHRNSLLSSAVAETNRRSRYIDQGVTGALVVIGLLSILDLTTGALGTQYLWRYAQTGIAIVAVYYGFMEFLQKPKLGLNTFLSWLAPRLLAARLKPRGLAVRDVPGFKVENGRVIWSEPN